jgi:hypothetical protein
MPSEEEKEEEGNEKSRRRRRIIRGKERLNFEQQSVHNLSCLLFDVCFCTLSNSSMFTHNHWHFTVLYNINYTKRSKWCMISDISDQTLNGRKAIISYNHKSTYSFDTLLNVYCPARPYAASKITVKWPSKPYASLCMFNW